MGHYKNQNYYDILGVSKDASLEEIIKARNSLKFEKKVPMNEWASIDEAYDILSNPFCRKEYDKILNNLKQDIEINNIDLEISKENECFFVEKFEENSNLQSKLKNYEAYDSDYELKEIKKQSEEIDKELSRFRSDYRLKIKYLKLQNQVALLNRIAEFKANKKINQNNSEETKNELEKIKAEMFDTQQQLNIIKEMLSIAI